MNKTAFLSDMAWYLKTNAPLTGEAYVKQSHGPIARHMMSALRELVDDGHLEERQVEHFGYAKFEYHPVREFDASILSEAECKVIDEMAEFVCMKNTARSISDFTHNETWRIAALGEELPYFLATDLLDAEVDEADLAWGAREVRHVANTKPKYRSVHSKRIGTVCRELYEASGGSRATGR